MRSSSYQEHLSAVQQHMSFWFQLSETIKSEFSVISLKASIVSSKTTYFPSPLKRKRVLLLAPSCFLFYIARGLTVPNQDTSAGLGARNGSLAIRDNHHSLNHDLYPWSAMEANKHHGKEYTPHSQPLNQSRHNSKLEIKSPLPPHQTILLLLPSRARHRREIRQRAPSRLYDNNSMQPPLRLGRPMDILLIPPRCKQIPEIKKRGFRWDGSEFCVCFIAGWA